MICMWSPSSSSSASLYVGNSQYISFDCVYCVDCINMLFAKWYVYFVVVFNRNRSTFKEQNDLIGFRFFYLEEEIYLSFFFFVCFIVIDTLEANVMHDDILIESIYSPIPGFSFFPFTWVENPFHRFVHFIKILLQQIISLFILFFAHPLMHFRCDRWCDDLFSFLSLLNSFDDSIPSARLTNAHPTLFS